MPKKPTRPAGGRGMPPVALGREVVHESGLPLPWVMYPSHYGAFHMFAALNDGPWRFCACSRPAFDNLAEILHREIASQSGDAYETRRLWSQSVPMIDIAGVPIWDFV